MEITLIFILVAAITGLFIGILIKGKETARIEKEKKEFAEKYEQATLEVKKLTETLAEKQTELTFYQDFKKQITEDFTAIANKVIKEEQSDLREQNKETIEEKLKPLKENFDKFKEKIEEFNKQGMVNTATIKTQIETMMTESTAIKTTADELSKAIKANAQARGVFGEIILDNILKQTGLINKKDDEIKGNYITQKIFKDLTNPNENPKPDAVVYLPDNKHIIIDSKCPLNNFIEYCKSNDENELKEFFKSAEKMIKELSGKYNSLEGLNTPNFKLMFIPLEACAGYIYGNTDLINKAAKHNIIIVCPSTLLATLKIINRTWEQKNQTERLGEILVTATNAYEKLILFLKNAEDIRTKLKSADKAFETFFSSATGKGGFVKQIEKLRELGMPISKRVDEKYLENTEENV